MATFEVIRAANIGGGGGGSSLFPLTGTGGPATGDVVGLIGSHKLTVNDGTTDLLSVVSDESFLQSWNTTGDGNYGNVYLNTTNTTSFASIGAGFNGEATLAYIQLNADASTSTIVATAGGGIALSAPNSTTASILSNGQISFWLDEVGNNLKVAVQYSGGTTKTGTVALT